MTCNNCAKALPGVIACGSVAEPRCRVGRRLRGCHSQSTDVIENKDRGRVEVVAERSERAQGARAYDERDGAGSRARRRRDPARPEPLQLLFV